MSTQATLPPETPAEAKSGGGVVLQRFVGRHSWALLILGDCFGELPEITADVTITDPPYGATACEWDSRPDLAAMWALLSRTGSTKTVMTATEPFATDVIVSNRENFRWDDVWVKPPCGMLMKDRPLRAHERILVFGRGVYHAIKTDTRNLQVKLGKVKKLNSRGEAEAYGQKNWTRDTWEETGERCAKSVVYFARKKNNQFTLANQHHPTEKPVGLMQYLVEMHTDPGAVVFDPFAGSGSTGVACVRTGRNFIGIERDAAHYKTACDRIAHELDGALL
jgi:site-specific DNA-methyltransferase (adenine-specific)